MKRTPNPSDHVRQLLHAADKAPALAPRIRKGGASQTEIKNGCQTAKSRGRSIKC
jgi:hypothetical protein